MKLAGQPIRSPRPHAEIVIEGSLGVAEARLVELGLVDPDERHPGVGEDVGPLGIRGSRTPRCLRSPTRRAGPKLLRAAAWRPFSSPRDAHAAIDGPADPWHDPPANEERSGDGGRAGAVERGRAARGACQTPRLRPDDHARGRRVRDSHHPARASARPPDHWTGSLLTCWRRFPALCSPICSDSPSSAVSRSPRGLFARFAASTGR